MAHSRGQDRPAGVCRLLLSLKGLVFLGGASEGPQTAGLVARLSKDTMDSGLVASQAVGVVKALMVEGYPAIGNRVAV